MAVFKKKYEFDYVEVVGNFRRNDFKVSVDKVGMQGPCTENKEAVRHGVLCL